MLLIIECIVDWAWANSEVIDPVASIQKQTSIKPNAGIGKWSFDLVLKIVFLMLVGWTLGRWTARIDFLAGLVGSFETPLLAEVFLPELDFFKALDLVIFFCFLPLLESSD